MVAGINLIAEEAFRQSFEHTIGRFEVIRLHNLEESRTVTYLVHIQRFLCSFTLTLALSFNLLDLFMVRNIILTVIFSDPVYICLIVV